MVWDQIIYVCLNLHTIIITLRAFQKDGPTLWNELPFEIGNRVPLSLDSFEVYLKTFIYKRAYDIDF